MFKTPLRDVEPQCSSYVGIIDYAGLKYEHTFGITFSPPFDPTENRRTATSRCSTEYIALDPEVVTWL